MRISGEGDSGYLPNTPTVTPSNTPTITPSNTPSVTPSNTPSTSYNPGVRIYNPDGTIQNQVNTPATPDVYIPETISAPEVKPVADTSVTSDYYIQREDERKNGRYGFGDTVYIGNQLYAYDSLGKLVRFDAGNPGDPIDYKQTIASYSNQVSQIAPTSYSGMTRAEVEAIRKSTGYDLALPQNAYLVDVVKGGTTFSNYTYENGSLPDATKKIYAALGDTYGKKGIVANITPYTDTEVFKGDLGRAAESDPSRYIPARNINGGFTGQGYYDVKGGHLDIQPFFSGYSHDQLSKMYGNIAADDLLGNTRTPGTKGTAASANIYWGPSYDSTGVNELPHVDIGETFHVLDVSKTSQLGSTPSITAPGWSTTKPSNSSNSIIDNILGPKASAASTDYANTQDIATKTDRGMFQGFYDAFEDITNKSQGSITDRIYAASPLGWAQGGIATMGIVADALVPKDANVRQWAGDKTYKPLDATIPEGAIHNDGSNPAYNNIWGKPSAQYPYIMPSGASEESKAKLDEYYEQQKEIQTRMAFGMTPMGDTAGLGKGVSLVEDIIPRVPFVRNVAPQVKGVTNAFDDIFSGFGSKYEQSIWGQSAGETVVKSSNKVIESGVLSKSPGEVAESVFSKIDSSIPSRLGEEPSLHFQTLGSINTGGMADYPGAVIPFNKPAYVYSYGKKAVVTAEDDVLKYSGDIFTPAPVSDADSFFRPPDVSYASPGIKSGNVDMGATDVTDAVTDPLISYQILGPKVSEVNVVAAKDMQDIAGPSLFSKIDEAIPFRGETSISIKGVRKTNARGDLEADEINNINSVLNTEGGHAGILNTELGGIPKDTTLPKLGLNDGIKYKNIADDSPILKDYIESFKSKYNRSPDADELASLKEIAGVTDDVPKVKLSSKKADDSIYIKEPALNRELTPEETSFDIHVLGEDNKSLFNTKSRGTVYPKINEDLNFINSPGREALPFDPLRGKINFETGELSVPIEVQESGAVSWGSGVSKSEASYYDNILGTKGMKRSGKVTSPTESPIEVLDIRDVVQGPNVADEQGLFTTYKVAQESSGAAQKPIHKITKHNKYTSGLDMEEVMKPVTNVLAKNIAEEAALPATKMDIDLGSQIAWGMLGTKTNVKPKTSSTDLTPDPKRRVVDDGSIPKFDRLSITSFIQGPPVTTVPVHDEFSGDSHKPPTQKTKPPLTISGTDVSSDVKDAFWQDVVNLTTDDFVTPPPQGKQGKDYVQDIIQGQTTKTFTKSGMAGRGETGSGISPGFWPAMSGTTPGNPGYVGKGPRWGRKALYKNFGDLSIGSVDLEVITGKTADKNKKEKSGDVNVGLNLPSILGESKQVKSKSNNGKKKNKPTGSKNKKDATQDWLTNSFI